MSSHHQSSAVQSRHIMCASCLGLTRESLVFQHILWADVEYVIADIVETRHFSFQDVGGKRPFSEVLGEWPIRIVTNTKRIWIDLVFSWTICDHRLISQLWVDGRRDLKLYNIERTWNEFESKYDSLVFSILNRHTNFFLVFRTQFITWWIHPI